MSNIHTFVYILKNDSLQKQFVNIFKLYTEVSVKWCAFVVQPIAKCQNAKLSWFNKSGVEIFLGSNLDLFSYYFSNSTAQDCAIHRLFTSTLILYSFISLSQLCKISNIKNGFLMNLYVSNTEYSEKHIFRKKMFFVRLCASVCLFLNALSTENIEVES